jgi:hypothetical protein
MSFPVPPAIPALPSAPNPAPQTQLPPSVQPVNSQINTTPSTSSSDLVSSSQSTQNNANVNNTRISNTSVNNSELRGSTLRVGDISVESAQIYFNATYNPAYNESVFTGGVVIPLGGGKARRAANNIAYAESQVTRANLCLSVSQNQMTEEMVDAVFEKDAKWLKKCVVAAKVVELKEKARQATSTAKLELRALKAEIKVLKARPAIVVPPVDNGTPALW